MFDQEEVPISPTSEVTKPKATRSKKHKKKSAKKASKASAPVTTEPTSDIEAPPEKKPTPKAKPISILNAAHAILDKEGAPLHANLLADRINAEYGHHTNGKSLAASLPGDSTQRFDNIGNNTWVIRQWPDEKKKTRPVAVAATA